MDILECVLKAFLDFVLDPKIWTITVPLFVAIWTWRRNEKSKRDWENWQLRKTACLNALNIANAILSNYSFGSLHASKLVPQYEKVEDVRACMNELACVCNGPEVIDLMKKIMFSDVSLDVIVDLRSAVRKELNMHLNDIDLDRDRAFVGSIVCDPRCMSWRDENNS